MTRTHQEQADFEHMLEADAAMDDDQPQRWHGYYCRPAKLTDGEDPENQYESE